MFRAKTGFPEVDRVLRSIVSELRNEQNSVYLAGELAAGVPKRFPHGLGRPWTHWILTRSTATSPVFEVNVSSTDTTKEIFLQCAVAADVEILLY